MIKLLHLELALLLLLSPLYAYAQGFGGVSGTGGVTGVGGGAGGVTWALEQDVVEQNTGSCSTTNSTTTCQVTISAPHAGDTIEFFLFTAGGESISSISGGTFTHCTTVGGAIQTCFVNNGATAGGQDASYILSAAGTETNLNASLSAPETSYMQGEVIVLRRSTGTATLDASGALNITSNCTACAGVTLTTGSDDAIVEYFNPQNSSGSPFVNSPWTQGTASGSSAGYKLNSGFTSPTFNQTPTGQAVVSGIAIK